MSASAKAHREFEKLLVSQGVAVELVRSRGKKTSVYFRDAGGSIRAYPIHGLRTPTSRQNALAAILRIVRGQYSMNGGALSPSRGVAEPIIDKKFAELPPGTMRHRVPPRPPKQTPATSAPALPLFPTATEGPPENPTMTTETNGAPRKSRSPKVYLTPPERYQLTRWMEAGWSDTEKRRPTLDEAAAAAAAALGNPKINARHITHAVESLGRIWPNSRPSRGPDPSRALALALITLYDQLGVPIPADLQQIAGR